MTDVHVDASAIVSILAGEPDKEALIYLLAQGETRSTSIVSAFEAVISMGRITGDRKGALEAVSEFLDRSGIEIAPVEGRLLATLASTHTHYGRGSSHPARLNMGDCFSYAMAKQAGAQLLYKGNDFAQTDLA